MHFKLPSKLLISACLIATAAATWHLLCIIGGPSWFVFARAPQAIITSAEQGTLLAAAGIIPKIPFMKTALMTIATLCTLRGLIAIPTFITTTGFDIWQIVASSIWFYVDICFIAGSLEQFKLSSSTRSK